MEANRSSDEIRASLSETRSRLSADLDALGDRLRGSFSTKNLMSRYPAFVIGAGALTGCLLFRRPMAIVRMATRLAGLSAPILIPIALRRILGEDHEARSYPSES